MKKEEINYKELKEFTTTNFCKNFLMFLDLEIERYNHILDKNDDMVKTYGTAKQRETIVDLKKKINGWKDNGNTLSGVNNYE